MPSYKKNIRIHVHCVNKYVLHDKGGWVGLIYPRCHNCYQAGPLVVAYQHHPDLDVCRSFSRIECISSPDNPRLLLMSASIGVSIASHRAMSSPTFRIQVGFDEQETTAILTVLADDGRGALGMMDGSTVDGSLSDGSMAGMTLNK